MAVYAPALDAGIITPATVYEDSPLNEDRNWPQNDSRSYSGLCNVLRGLTRSLNTISVKVLNDLGVENSYQFLTQKLGFTTLVDELQIGDHSYTDIALAPLGLGQLTRGVTVREMTPGLRHLPERRHVPRGPHVHKGRRPRGKGHPRQCTGEPHRHR